jgi:hypothetical protein
MKKFKDVFTFIGIQLAIIFALAVLFLYGCSGSTVTDKVCDYGTVLCDVSTTLCTEIPGVPNEVCNYLDLACFNLNQLCDLRDSTESKNYQTALSNLEKITMKLREWKAARVQK